MATPEIKSAIATFLGALSAVVTFLLTAVAMDQFAGLFTNTHILMLGAANAFLAFLLGKGNIGQIRVRKSGQ